MNLQSESQKGKSILNWGNMIVLSFIVFAGFIFTMIYFMTTQKVDLISENYYQNEIDFQKHIQQVGNATNLKNKVAVDYQAAQNSINILFPTVVQEGEVVLFRPSNRDLDVNIPISTLKQPSITLPTDKLLKGIWKVKISWSDGTKKYFSEHEIKI